jgi:acyl-CoA thioester hydrolase
MSAAPAVVHELGVRHAPFRLGVHTRVEIADTDLGGVVYYARYPHFLDRAATSYRRHLGVPLLGPAGHLFVVRSLEVDYRAAARFDDPLVVLVRTAEIGRSSHVLEMHVTRAEDGAPGPVLVRARQVIVGVSDYEAPRPTRIPADVVDAIRGFEGDSLGAP